MSEFCTGIVEAAVHLAVKDNPAADASAKCNAHAAAGSPRRTGQRFAERSRIGVILNGNRDAQVFLKPGLDRHMVKPQIVGVFDNAVGGVTGTGAADADMLHIAASPNRPFPPLHTHACLICDNLPRGP